MKDAQPWVYLSECSESALNEYIVSRQTEASNIWKRVKVDLERLVEVKAEIQVAAILKDNRKTLGLGTLTQESFDFSPAPELHFAPPQRTHPRNKGLKVWYAE